MHIEIIQDKGPRGQRVGGYRTHNVRQEVFLGTRWTNRLREHFPGGHVEIADQCRRAVTLVFEFLPGDVTGTHRLVGGCAFQGLEASHLINAHGMRAVFHFFLARRDRFGRLLQPAVGTPPDLSPSC